MTCLLVFKVHTFNGHFLNETALSWPLCLMCFSAGPGEHGSQHAVFFSVISGAGLHQLKNWLWNSSSGEASEPKPFFKPVWFHQKLCSDLDVVAVLPAQVFGFLVTGVYGLNTFLAVRRYRRGNGSQGAAQANDYIRARTASRGEMEARSVIAWEPTGEQLQREMRSERLTVMDKGLVILTFNHILKLKWQPVRVEGGLIKLGLKQRKRAMRKNKRKTAASAPFSGVCADSLEGFLSLWM